MADSNTTAPPVSPSEGSVRTLPPDEEITAFFDKLEAEAELETWKRMAAQVPPLLQEKFLERFPRPEDPNDTTPAEPAAAEPAKSY